MAYGDRIPTGVGRTTIQNPAELTGLYNRYYANRQFTHWEGQPSAHKFNRIQGRHYAALSEILSRNGLAAFEYIGACTYVGLGYGSIGSANLERHVAVAPGMVWEKYEGVAKGGGQNRIYAGGRKVPLSEFLSWDTAEQDALVSNTLIEA